VSLWQYLKAVPDRQAVDLLRYHAGWNFALNRQVGDELFHPTTLVHFRQRLLDHDLSTIGFAMVLEALVAAGLVARQSRQRLALLELAQPIQVEARPGWWSLLWERYVDSQADDRAPLETLARKMVEAGTDAQQWLGWLASPAAKEWAQGKQAALLARVFSEQFEVLAGSGAPQPKTKEQVSSERVQNPHDPDATYAAKGKGEQKKEHVGYKVQVAETVCEAVLAPGEPTRHFISGIVTHAARESDQEGSQKMEREQQAMGLDKPPVQYVDAAYVSTRKLVEAAAEGRELIGPALASPHNNEGRFTPEQFHVAVEQRPAVCPAGQESTQCSPLQEQATGKVSYRFEWSSSVCGQCLLRQPCIKADHPHRTLAVGEHHTTLQARRQEQQTKSFKQRMRHRNAIEGTQSELVRAHGLRRARYRGLAKARLQNYFIGAACNIKRWLRRIAWEWQNGLMDKLSAATAN
jgi:transposase